MTRAILDIVDAIRARLPRRRKKGRTFVHESNASPLQDAMRRVEMEPVTLACAPMGRTHTVRRTINGLYTIGVETKFGMMYQDGLTFAEVMNAIATMEPQP